MTTAASFLLGLLAGVFLGSALVEHAARRMAGPAWLAYKQAKERVFGPVMPAFFALVLLVVGAAAVIYWPDRRLLAAVVLLVVALAITVIAHLPLNTRFDGWSADALPADWDAARRRWRRWNWARTLPVMLAFACVLS